jgi:hypothetical protein
MENEVGMTCGMQDREEKCTGLWWESLQEKDHLKDRGTDGRMELEGILGILAGGGGETWSGFTWLKIGATGGLSCMWW